MTEEKPKSVVLEVQDVKHNISDFFTVEHVDRYNKTHEKSEIEKISEIMNGDNK